METVLNYRITETVSVCCKIYQIELDLGKVGV